MAQHKQNLAVGEKAYVPASCVYVRQPGNSVFVHRYFLIDGANSEKDVMIERVSTASYRATLPAGFRAEHYSQSDSHLSGLQPIHEVVDEQGATHTTMPSKYLVL